MVPLSGERERGTIRQDGWWKVESSMLERRNVDRCDWYIKSMEQHFLSYIPFLRSVFCQFIQARWTQDAQFPSFPAYDFLIFQVVQFAG